MLSSSIAGEQFTVDDCDIFDTKVGRDLFLSIASHGEHDKALRTLADIVVEHFPADRNISRAIAGTLETAFLSAVMLGDEELSARLAAKCVSTGNSMYDYSGLGSLLEALGLHGIPWEVVQRVWVQACQAVSIEDIRQDWVRTWATTD